MPSLTSLFFKSLRTVLGPVLLLKESLTRPKGLVRPPAAQQAVDLACRELALYQYQTCPFCIMLASRGYVYDETSKDFHAHAHCDCRIVPQFGGTRVLSAASASEGVPRWRKGSGLGWVTAEYAMLPASTNTRSDRESVKGRAAPPEPPDARGKGDGVTEVGRPRRRHVHVHEPD